MSHPPNLHAVKPATVDGAALLDQIEKFLARFIVFPSEAARIAVTLWAAHAHFVDGGDNTPRLALLSPEPGSGKTRTLEILELLVPSPMSALNGSPAPIFRSLAVTPRTLLFDEVDALFGRSGKSDDPAADLRALLNAGHRKGATIPRCVGPKHEVHEFPVYAAVALAGLGDLPDTLMSRSVIIRMRRRAPAERVQPFRRRLHAAEGEELRDQLAQWADEASEQVGSAWPEMPAGVEDRPADVWEPLLAIADAAGGQWRERARTACRELVKVAEAREASLGVRLLGDLRSVFGDTPVMHTETILTELCKLDEAPWADLRGKQLDARGLARRLREYGIKSQSVEIAGKNLKGYKREDLWDAWSRYLSPPSKQASGPSGPKGSQVSGLDDLTAPDVPDAHDATPDAERTPSDQAVDGPDGPDAHTDPDSEEAERAEMEIAGQLVMDVFTGAVEIGTCRQCQQPNTDLVGRDRRDRPACSDCTHERKTSWLPKSAGQP